MKKAESNQNIEQESQEELALLRAYWKESEGLPQEKVKENDEVFLEAPKGKSYFRSFVEGETEIFSSGKNEAKRGQRPFHFEEELSVERVFDSGQTEKNLEKQVRPRLCLWLLLVLLGTVILGVSIYWLFFFLRA